MLSGIGKALFANEVRRSTSAAGFAGMAAVLAFNLLLKRSPVGAAAWGGAMIARKVYKSRKAGRAGRSVGRTPPGS